MATKTIGTTDRTDTPYYKSSEYKEHEKQVAKVTAVFEGSDAAVDYLNKFVREDDDAFEYRQTNLTLLNFVKRTITTSRNKIFRKPVQFEGTITDDEQAKLTQLLMDTIDYIMRDGFAYLVVDTPVKPAEVTNKAAAVAAGFKPYMYVVERKHVPNWTSEIIDSTEIFSHITFNEKYDEEVGRYGVIEGDQQRVYVLENGKVTIEIWRDDELKTDMTVNTDFTEVPVVKVGAEDIPFLYDMAKINISHMNRRSELNRYLRVAATPVPVIHGAEDTGAKIVIGVDNALMFKRKDEGDFKWVELTGSATNLLQDDLKVMEGDMLEMATTLTSNDESDSIKTATQVNSEDSEGESRLSNVATETEKGVNRALAILGTYGGYKVQVSLNRDYDSNVLTPEQINTTITMYREGVIDLDTAWGILIAGEILPADFDKEKTKTGLITE